MFHVEHMPSVPLLFALARVLSRPAGIASRNGQAEMFHVEHWLSIRGSTQLRTTPLATDARRISSFRRPLRFLHSFSSGISAAFPLEQLPDGPHKTTLLRVGKSPHYPMARVIAVTN